MDARPAIGARPVRRLAAALAFQLLCTTSLAQAENAGHGLLFHVSADRGFVADQASGDAVPSFQSKVSIVPDGKAGGAIRWDDDGHVAWRAPGNIYAQRGTLSFFWRSRSPVGEAPFNIFRVGFADHSSWDMAFLRIDWNGHGFDGFVTDANLSRVRVSWRMERLPEPDAWHHIAFAWDEGVGVRLYVDGKEAARKDQAADLDSGLDQLGLAARTVSPYQVTNAYHFMRGSDIDEIRIYDHMLGAPDMAQLAGNEAPAPAPAPSAVQERQAWLHRFGWDRATPAELTAPSTRVRKVEFADTRDLKQWMWKGTDGIAETTWPGVYNRSRLPGRDDYFELPDWNVYVEGGKAYELTVPANERVNRVEIRGAAYGFLASSADGGSWRNVATRPQGVVRSFDSIRPQQGGRLRFTNVMQEQPIQEIWAYDVDEAREPDGLFKLGYTVDVQANAAELPALGALDAFIAGRFPATERQTVVALPDNSKGGEPGASAVVQTKVAVRPVGSLPLVHILIPSNFSDWIKARPLGRGWNAGWDNLQDGLDGIALDVPALAATPGKDGLIALNIRVKDPLWPGRDMIDVSVSVRPGQARTLWLDLRDRVLTSDSLYIAIASAAPDFGAQSLDGMKIRLVFKAREQAKLEHVADRFNQVRDNWGFIVEEHVSTKGLALYRRLYGDISDLLRVDPGNVEGRRWWADIAFNKYSLPPFVQPRAPVGVPLWAFRQLEDLKLVDQFISWWIDERQVAYGDFGGGISDDTDMTQQWPALALMGVKPDKVNQSLRMLSDAVYKNGMITDGLGNITTDELHAYEEGLNSDAERLYLNWGEPKAVERLMATTRALSAIIIPNAQGHVHFSSDWYGHRKVYREGVWEWQKPHSFSVMHGPIVLGLYNGDPTARGLVTGLIDGWMAHGKQDAGGGWSFPDEINWRTDAVRRGDGGGGAGLPYQSAWAAWRFSGDDKYLRPMLGRLARSGPGSLSDVEENAFAALPAGMGWAKQLAANADGGAAFAQYAAWTASGDTKWLDKLHADGIADKSQRMYLNTEGSLWTDRVEAPSEYLQRERLGGVAIKRHLSFPGHSVSWRFAEPDGAEQVAILVPGATRDHFKVIAYNMSDRPQRATMTAWNVTAGRWKMTSGTSVANASVADGEPAVSEVGLERSASTGVQFAPRTTTVMEFTLAAAGAPPEGRPDLGIGVDDIRADKGRIEVTVHSLGVKPTAGGEVSLIDSCGKVLAHMPVPAMAAPLDLLPRKTMVTIPVPAGVDLARASIHVALPNRAPEVTYLNNDAPVGARAEGPAASRCELDVRGAKQSAST